VPRACPSAPTAARRCQSPSRASRERRPSRGAETVGTGLCVLRGEQSASVSCLPFSTTKANPPKIDHSPDYTLIPNLMSDVKTPLTLIVEHICTARRHANSPPARPPAAAAAAAARSRQSRVQRRDAGGGRASWSVPDLRWWVGSLVGSLVGWLVDQAACCEKPMVNAGAPAPCSRPPGLSGHYRPSPARCCRPRWPGRNVC
jgi:hypothetical protein